MNTLARDIACFRDEHPFPGRRKPVRLLKRAQIFVADIWACFNGESWGAFRDIDKITMFADYRVPQILASLGCIGYSPPLQQLIAEGAVLESGTVFEMQLRGNLASQPPPPPAAMRVSLTLVAGSLQHLVRGTHQERDWEAAPGRQSERHFDRLLSV